MRCSSVIARYDDRGAQFKEGGISAHFGYLRAREGELGKRCARDRRWPRRRRNGLPKKNVTGPHRYTVGIVAAAPYTTHRDRRDPATYAAILAAMLKLLNRVIEAAEEKKR
jgi:hypothetical protein